MDMPPVAPRPVAPPGAPLDPLLALTEGWNAFRANAWMSVGVLVVLFAIVIAGSIVPFAGLLFALLVEPALLAGGAWFFLRGVRRENPPFEAAFDGFQRWPSATGAVLVVGLVGFLILLPVMVVTIGVAGVAALLTRGAGHAPSDFPGGMGALLLPVMLVVYPLEIWWTARSYMTVFIVMEPDHPGAIEAVRRSFALTRGSVWRLVGLWLLMIPVGLAGLLALCVGIVPAAAVGYFAFAHAYEQLRARAGTA